MVSIQMAVTGNDMDRTLALLYWNRSHAIMNVHSNNMFSLLICDHASKVHGTLIVTLG